MASPLRSWVAALGVVRRLEEVDELAVDAAVLPLGQFANPSGQLHGEPHPNHADCLHRSPLGAPSWRLPIPTIQQDGAIVKRVLVESYGDTWTTPWKATCVQACTTMVPARSAPRMPDSTQATVPLVRAAW